MYKFIVLALISTWISLAHGCGETVVLQQGESFELRSEGASKLKKCSTSIAAQNGIEVVCPHIDVCTFLPACSMFNYVRFIGSDTFYSTMNIHFTHLLSSPLIVNYSYNPNSKFAGIGFECSFYAIKRHSCDCDCGRKAPRGRIIGGSPVTINDYPWTVRLIISSVGKKYHCGGIIISKLYVLTAAHCLDYLPLMEVKVYVGEHNITSDTETYDAIYTARSVRIHSRYNRTTFENDIGLIRLNDSINFNNGSRPACLPNTNFNFAGYSATVIGWGASVLSGNISVVMNEVEVPIIKNRQCESALIDFGLENVSIQSTQLCTYKAGSPRNPCSGDSGGPLMVEIGGRTFVVGIISYTVECGDHPAVHTRVSSYIDFIQESTIENICIP